MKIVMQTFKEKLDITPEADFEAILVSELQIRYAFIPCTIVDSSGSELI
jgi:hypothetical protein